MYLLPVLPLDDLLTRQGIPHADIGFLKMDVQSFEYYVLQGAGRVLRVQSALWGPVGPGGTWASWSWRSCWRRWAST